MTKLIKPWAAEGGILERVRVTESSGKVRRGGSVEAVWGQARGGERQSLYGNDLGWGSPSSWPSPPLVLERSRSLDFILLIVLTWLN